ncbi:hypothetical protein CDAR_165141 [Caerostris darwini]|uniref:Uncharacterized protein n=1 Tax=Caerostris darwini TaxID=1538125 RepID=A0AAV4NVG2_9ARAC|nr:hypothetical protein CDAR_165141 [Caerostris darwini]
MICRICIMALRYYFPDLSSSDEEGPSTFTVFTEVHRDPSPCDEDCHACFPLLAGIRRGLSLSSLSSESSDEEERRVKRRRLNSATAYSSENEGSSVVPVRKNSRLQSNQGATPVAGKPTTIYCRSTSSLKSEDVSSPDVVPIKRSPPLQIREGTTPVAGKPPTIICSSEDESCPDSVPVRKNPSFRSKEDAPPVAGKPHEELQADVVPEEMIVPCCVHLQHLEEVPRTSSPPPRPSRVKRPSRPSPYALGKLILLKLTVHRCAEVHGYWQQPKVQLCLHFPRRKLPPLQGKNRNKGIKGSAPEATYKTWKHFDTREPSTPSSASDFSTSTWSQRRSEERYRPNVVGHLAVLQNCSVILINNNFVVYHVFNVYWKKNTIYLMLV